MSAKLRRVGRDLIEVLTHPLENVSIYLGDDANLYKWIIKILPTTEMLEEIPCYFEMTFPQMYPTVPMKLRLLSQVRHKCVDDYSRTVCLHMLNEGGDGTPYTGWSPAYSALSVLRQLQHFFDDKLVHEQNIGLLRRQVDKFEVEALKTKFTVMEYQQLRVEIDTNTSVSIDRKPNTEMLQTCPEDSSSKDGSEEHLDFSTQTQPVAVSTKPVRVKTAALKMKTFAAAPLSKPQSTLQKSKSQNMFAVLAEDKESDQCVSTAQRSQTVSLTHAVKDPRQAHISCKTITTRAVNSTSSAVLSSAPAPHPAPVSKQQGKCAPPPAGGSSRIVKSSTPMSVTPMSVTSLVDFPPLPAVSAHTFLSKAIVSKALASASKPSMSEFCESLWDAQLRKDIAPGSHVQALGKTILPAEPSVEAALVLSPSAQSMAGSLGRLPPQLLQVIMLLCDACDVGNMMSTCSYLRAVCADGFIWQPLLYRYFPDCTLIPKGVVGSCADWRRIWEMEAHGVHYDELRCFFSKQSFTEDVLGIPLQYTVNPRTENIDYICSTMDLVSHSVLSSNLCKKSVWGEKITAWLPLYFTQDHFARALPLLEQSLLTLAPMVGRTPALPVGSSYVANRKPLHRQLNISATKITPDLILEIVPRLMSTMVVLLADKGASHAEEALRGYCQLHRLFVALVQSYPELKVEIRNRLRSFIINPSSRTKEMCNLGELVPLLSVCEEVGWLDIAGPLMEESFSRSVLWACRDVPELAAIANKSFRELQTLVADSKRNSADAGAAVPAHSVELLEKIFAATSVSRRLFSFHCCFLKLVCQPRGAKLGDISRAYDRTLGTPPRHMRAKMRKFLQQIEGTQSWPEYFDSVCLRRVGPKALMHMWLQSVLKSMQCRYHNQHTDFSRIQQSGVSSILLRGLSYPRVVICIDVSGSMCCTFVDASSGKYISRLDYVKRDVQKIFKEELNHRQQFTLILFNDEANTWSTGLRQCTVDNLDAASRFIESCQPDGGTDFNAALTAAYGVKDVSAVFFLSDGEDYDTGLREKVKALSLNGKIPCHTTAFFASSTGQELLKSIATITGGSYLMFDNSKN